MFVIFVSIEKDIEVEGGICLALKFIAEIFGIFGGTIGISLSKSKKDTQMKCLWKGFITLVSFQLSATTCRINNILVVEGCLRLKTLTVNV